MSAVTVCDSCYRFVPLWRRLGSLVALRFWPCGWVVPFVVVVPRALWAVVESKKRQERKGAFRRGQVRA